MYNDNYNDIVIILVDNKNQLDLSLSNVKSDGLMIGVIKRKKTRRKSNC